MAMLGMYATRTWGIHHDAPLMFFVAQRIAEGGSPYRDVLDMNLPGAYLLSWAVLSWFGYSDLAWRLVDLGALASIAFCVFWIVRPAGRALALTAAASTIFVHLEGGPHAVGQRDFLMILPVLLALVVLLAVNAVSHPAQRCTMLLGAGFLLMCAAFFKPTAILLSPLAAAWLLFRPGLSLASIKDTAAVLGGGALALSLLLGWLLSLGAVVDFVSLQIDFILPSYGNIRMPRSSCLGSVLVLPALVGIPFLVMSRHRVRYAIVLVLVVFGLLHFHVQGKYWAYHAAPLQVFSIAAAFLGLGMLIEQLSSRKALVAGLAVLTVQAGTLMLVLENFGVRAWLHGKSNVHPEDRLTKSLEVDLRRMKIASSMVQPLDTTHGAVNAMLRLGLSMPTRFLYDFPFYMTGRTRYLDSLRVEFLAAMEKASYPAIIRTNQQWPYESGYDRLEAWPAFREMIERHYSIAIERAFPDGKGYRIYVARRT
ncbi:MAG: hypothetical protein JNM30_16005 [Rhodospirillales bacterium]|nr:hypothetical protein [Rhodospirillales bacterium]